MTPAKLAQRRAAKLQRRKAIAGAKRKGATDVRDAVIFADEEFAPASLMGEASAALMEVAEPLLQLVQDRDEMREALALALLAWNLSLLPEQERMEQMARLMEDLVSGIAEDGAVTSEEFFDGFGKMMAMLISRKRALFPLDDRELADVQVRQGRERCYVTVTAARRCSVSERAAQGQPLARALTHHQVL